MVAKADASLFHLGRHYQTFHSTSLVLQQELLVVLELALRPRLPSINPLSPIDSRWLCLVVCGGDLSSATAPSILTSGCYPL